MLSDKMSVSCWSTLSYHEAVHVIKVLVFLAYIHSLCKEMNESGWGCLKCRGRECATQCIIYQVSTGSI